eukprot:1139952-Pelagomonas_calceolata.AAC.3
MRPCRPLPSAPFCSLHQVLLPLLPSCHVPLVLLALLMRFHSLRSALKADLADGAQRHILIMAIKTTILQPMLSQGTVGGLKPVCLELTPQPTLTTPGSPIEVTKGAAQGYFVHKPPEFV